MIQLIRSAANPTWFELHEDGRIIQEVEVLFRIRKIPKHFASLNDALKWLRATEQRLAKWHAMRLLSLRSYPSTILQGKLRARGFHACDELLAELEQMGLIQDDAWATREIERELAAGHGPRLIEAKWKAKGLDARRIREQLSEARQRERLEELWPKMLRQKKSDKQKAMQALLRRGFDFDAILAVAKT